MTADHRNLKRHCTTKHPGKAVFTCLDCSFNTGIYSELKSHLVSTGHSHNQLVHPDQVGGVAANASSATSMPKLPHDDSTDIDTVDQSESDFLEDPQLAEIHRQKWRYIRTQLPNATAEKLHNTKIYQIRQANQLRETLLAIHHKQQVGYRYNIEFSYILRSIEDNTMKYFGHGHNQRFH